MVHIALTIDTDESKYKSTEDVAEALSNQLNRLDESLTNTIINITSYEGRKHNWEDGDPCPNCGNDTFNVLEPVWDRYASIKDESMKYGNGRLEPIKHIGPDGPRTHIECRECNTVVHTQLDAPIRPPE